MKYIQDEQPKKGRTRLSDSLNLLFHCDNLESIQFLRNSGMEREIDLVYIDPPFQTGKRYFFRLKDKNKLAFSDRLESDAYFKMLESRLSDLRDLLSNSGSIFIHLDWHAVHHVKLLMDRIFGADNFRNEIIVKRGRRKNLQYQFEAIERMHNGYDSILWYSKNEKTKFTIPTTQQNSEAKWMGFWSNVSRPTMRYEIFGYTPERGQWKWSKSRALSAIRNYEIYQKKYSASMSLERYWESTNRSKEFIRKRDGVKYAEYWIPPKTHRILDNIWLDVEAYNYSTGYGTEKHEELLERIISQFSKPGDYVADFFCGSGTTLAVAERLGRKWIGCDSSAQAISVTRKRLGRADYSIVKI